MRRILFVLLALMMSVSMYAQNGFNGSVEINGGVGLDKYTNFSFGAAGVAGYKFADLFFVGAGVGIEYIDGLYFVDMAGENSIDARFSIQPFGRVKANFTKSAISPYALVDVGATINTGDFPIKMATGLFFEPGIGCDFRLNSGQGVYFHIGYNSQNYEYKSFIGVTEELRKVKAGEFKVHVGFRF